MKRLALCLAFIFWASAAFAQMSGVRVVATCGTPSPWPALQTNPLGLASTAWLTVDTNYNLCTSGVGGGGGGAITGPLGNGQTPAQSVAITINPVKAATGQTSVNVGLTSIALSAANACTHLLGVIVNPAETTPVWINANGGAATTASPSIELIPGMSLVWTSFIPTGGVNAIVSTGTANPVVECE